MTIIESFYYQKFFRYLSQTPKRNAAAQWRPSHSMGTIDPNSLFHCQQRHQMWCLLRFIVKDFISFLWLPLSHCSVDPLVDFLRRVLLASADRQETRIEAAKMVLKIFQSSHCARRLKLAAKRKSARRISRHHQKATRSFDTAEGGVVEKQMRTKGLKEGRSKRIYQKLAEEEERTEEKGEIDVDFDVDFDADFDADVKGLNDDVVETMIANKCSLLCRLSFLVRKLLTADRFSLRLAGVETVLLLLLQFDVLSLLDGHGDVYSKVSSGLNSLGIVMEWLSIQRFAG